MITTNWWKNKNNRWKALKISCVVHIFKEIQLFIENGLIDVLNDEQKNKYFTLKESLNIKKVYKLVDGEHKQVDLVTGLNSGGFTEIIKGELNEGDQVISKVIVETTQKKALRLF